MSESGGKLIWRDRNAPPPKPKYWVPFAAWARADVARRLEWERWANEQGMSIAIDLTDDASWCVPSVPRNKELGDFEEYAGEAHHNHLTPEGYNE